MDTQKIGEFIKDIRLKNDMTQREFADSLNVTYQAVSKWENGKNMPDIAVLKEISRIYGVDIKSILAGEEVEKKGYIKYKNLIIAGISLLTVLLIISFFIFKTPEHYNFKSVSSACEEFKITGLVAYDAKKSAFYISNIEYCGTQNDTKYNEISCTLYETYNDTQIRVSSCKEEKNMSLDDYLKSVQIKVDNYSTICKDFGEANFYLEIDAKTEDLMNYNHKIPLKIDNDC